MNHLGKNGDCESPKFKRAKNHVNFPRLTCVFACSGNGSRLSLCRVVDLRLEPWEKETPGCLDCIKRGPRNQLGNGWCCREKAARFFCSGILTFETYPHRGMDWMMKMNADVFNIEFFTPRDLGCFRYQQWKAFNILIRKVSPLHSQN